MHQVLVYQQSQVSPKSIPLATILNMTI